MLYQFLGYLHPCLTRFMDINPCCISSLDINPCCTSSLVIYPCCIFSLHINPCCTSSVDNNPCCRISFIDLNILLTCTFISLSKIWNNSWLTDRALGYMTSLEKKGKSIVKLSKNNTPSDRPLLASLTWILETPNSWGLCFYHLKRYFLQSYRFSILMHSKQIY